MGNDNRVITLIDQFDKALVFAGITHQHNRPRFHTAWVSPFGSLAFMLPEASRIKRMERSAVLQDWAIAAAGRRQPNSTMLL
jgi:hypothetical protein